MPIPNPFQNDISSVSGVPKTGISAIDDVAANALFTIDDIGFNYDNDHLPLHIGYSVRQLTTTATNCMDVINSSGTTRTIGFVDGYLDVSSLLNHCGSGYGLVTRFYDQSENGYDLICAETVSSPMIVDYEGNLIERNGKAALRFLLLPNEPSAFSNRFLEGETTGGGAYFKSSLSEFATVVFVASTHSDVINLAPIASQWQGSSSDGVLSASSQFDVCSFTVSSNKFRSLFGVFDNPNYGFGSVQSDTNIVQFEDYVVSTTIDTGSTPSISMAVNSVSSQYTGSIPSSTSLTITQSDTYPLLLGKSLFQNGEQFFNGFMNEFVVYSSNSHQQLLPQQISEGIIQETNEFYGVF